MALNCKQARQIPIVEYLAECGFQPQYIKGPDHWYLPPIREENTASFKVNTRLNVWFDFGIGEGGNLIDLGIRLHRCSVEELLARLAAGNYTLSFHQPSAATADREPVYHVNVALNTEERHIRVLDVRPLQNPELTTYITGRGIDLTTAHWYCREVDFNIKGKTYTAIGFENRSGGYELRNVWFKGSSSPKDITVISSNGNAQAVALVEGFMDFLSLQRLRKLPDTPIDIIVLNSVALVGRSIELLSKYCNIYQYLNHDSGGQAAAEKLKQAGIQTIDAGSFYQDHNDINAYLLAMQQRSLQQEIKPQQYEKHGHSLRR
jgi:DNA primase